MKEILGPVVIESLVLVLVLIMGTHYLVRMYGLWLPKRQKEYQIVGRYITGTLSIGIPFTFICWHFSWWGALGMFWTCALLAGVATLLFYWIDHTHDLVNGNQAKEKDLRKVGFPTEED